MRDSFIFYRSFYESINDLDDKTQLEIYRNIAKFSLDGNIDDLQGVSKAMFTLIRPQLEANNKRFSNGKKAKQKQSRSKTEAKQKQDESKDEANNNVNVNVNVNKNVNNNNNDIILFDEFWNLYPRKINKKKSETRFFNVLKNKEATFEQIKTGVENYVTWIEQEGTEQQFIKHPLTWLNGRCWEDELFINQDDDSTPY